MASSGKGESIKMSAKALFSAKFTQSCAVKDVESQDKNVLASDSDDEESKFDSRLKAFEPKKLSFHSEGSSRNHSVDIKSNSKNGTVFASDSDWEESKNDSHSEFLEPKKLSFNSKDSSRNQSLDTMNNSEITSKGLETRLLDENEESDGEESDKEHKSFLGKHEVILKTSSNENSDEEDNRVEKKKTKKPHRKRIIILSSSESESDSEKDDNNSFDLGAIKKKYQTPSHPKNNDSYRSPQSEDNYDFADSFINDVESSTVEETDSEEFDIEDEPFSGGDESSAGNDSNDDNNDSDDDLIPDFSPEKKITKKKTPRPNKKAPKKTPQNDEIPDFSSDNETPVTDRKLYKNSKTTILKPSTNLTKTLLASLNDEEVMQNTHPLAKKYIINFNKHKKELAEFLFKLYNSEIFDGCLPYDMKLTWSNTLLKTAGTCKQAKRIQNGQDIERYCEINLATKVLTSADRIRDTLIHEMCHAAAWIISGCHGNHGVVFKSWGKRAVKVFPELPLITRCHNYKIEGKFAYICTTCKHEYVRHSKSVNTDAKRCGRCKGPGVGKLILHILDKKSKKYVPYDAPDNQNGEQKIGTTSCRKPNAFANFVKENYKHCRTPGVSHSDAMKELSKKFASNKLT